MSSRQLAKLAMPWTDDNNRCSAVDILHQAVIVVIPVPFLGELDKLGRSHPHALASEFVTAIPAAFSLQVMSGCLFKWAVFLTDDVHFGLLVYVCRS